MALRTRVRNKTSNMPIPSQAPQRTVFAGARGFGNLTSFLLASSLTLFIRAKHFSELDLTIRREFEWGCQLNWINWGTEGPTPAWPSLFPECRFLPQIYRKFKMGRQPITGWAIVFSGTIVKGTNIEWTDLSKSIADTFKCWLVSRSWRFCMDVHG